MKFLTEYLDIDAEKYPGRPALTYKDKKISFFELRSRALSLAEPVAERGSGSPVGVFAERSELPVIRFLSVLYSGNFYVPLDPEMPKTKLFSIIEDAGIKTILGTKEQKDLLCGLEREICFIDDEAGAQPGGGEHPSFSPCREACIVYTSGSTGKPKGVLKSQAAMINFIEAYTSEFDFSSDDVIGNQTPFFFDASAKDLLLMLKTGACLDIIPTELFSTPVALISHMNERRITFASWVPTAAAIVAQLGALKVDTPKYLKKLFFVGEVMPMKYLNKWRAALPDVTYVNLYGQSELAGICCYYEVKGEYEDTAVLPMGKALGNCRIRLIDNGSVVNTPDRIGEIYISSPALADCYYNDPEKSAASFVSCDFGEGCERCFKTGDLACYDGQGNLVFASRSDHQIKHQGHRIELGEIEAVAGSLPEVSRCCCVYDAAKKKIVMFVQPSEGSSLDEKGIISALRGMLSSYMIPRKVVILQKLPINANGKIDRVTLSAMI